MLSFVRLDKANLWDFELVCNLCFVTIVKIFNFILILYIVQNLYFVSETITYIYYLTNQFFFYSSNNLIIKLMLEFYKLNKQA